MKRILLLLAFAISAGYQASAQQAGWGAGIRLGDPTGISLKKYLNDGKQAVELNIGRAYPYDYNYNSAFYHIGKYNNKDLYAYDHSILDNAFDLQLHWMVQRPFKNEKLSGLKWYIGAGGQLLASKVDYYYKYKAYYGPGNGNYVLTYGHSINTVAAFGADGIIGLEYTFKELPISVFLDGTIAMEVLPNPFLVWGQAGAGVRYNFNMSQLTGTGSSKKGKK
jgi:hypothetical protein